VEREVGHELLSSGRDRRPRRALSYDSAAFFLAIFSARAFASFSFLFFGSPEIK
jgi:hypothetical protein